MQALNSDKNVERHFQCSYGFLNLESYDPTAPGHKDASPVTDPLTKKKYVPVIVYFVMKVSPSLRPTSSYYVNRI